MDIRVVLFLITIFLTSCTSANKRINSHDMNNGIKYGIAYCMSQTYPNTEFSSDSRRISGSYIQVGSYGIDVYESIRDFVDAYRQKKYKSKHNKNLDIMQCIDLLALKELTEVIEKTANK